MNHTIEKDLISIIVPVYQVEAYLPKCIESVLNQSYSNFELMLVDDGSRDGSGKICDDYAKKDGRIRVVHQPNQGVSAARNHGLEMIRGEYVAFIDSDDYVKPDYLEVLHRDLIANGADLVCCDFVKSDSDKTLRQMYPLVYDARLIRKREVFFDDMTANGELYWSCVWGKLFKASFAQQIRFRPLRYGEDGIYMFDLFLLGPVAYLDPYEGYYYVERDNSAMAADSNLNLSRLSDEMQLARYRWLNLPQVRSQTHRTMLDYFARRLHKLAYASAVMKSKEYDASIRAALKEVLAHKALLTSRMRMNLSLCTYFPVIYRQAVRLKYARRNGKKYS